MDFSALAQNLIATTQSDVALGVERFHELCPDLVAQIGRDATRMGPLSFWGRSINFDELANQTIVDSAIIQLLSQISGKKLSRKWPHAGLQHTYGYLLSLIQTPYGMKRDRWIDTSLETAFGLNHSVLSPVPNEGTLLSNATWLAGQIAFRGNEANQNWLRSYLTGKCSSELDAISFCDLPQNRIVETVHGKNDSSNKIWSLQTDLVPFPTDSTISLLVYSVREETSGKHSLMTLFPAGQETQQELLARTEVACRDDIRLRFNAYVPALAGHVLNGTCELVAF